MTGTEKKYNKRKVLLGKDASAARKEIVRVVLFDILKRYGLNNCFRCGGKILDFKQLTIDHKEEWVLHKNPKEAFYDMDNIGFSHFGCNSSAGIKAYWESKK